MNNSPICKAFVLSDYFFRDNILSFFNNKTAQIKQKTASKPIAHHIAEHFFVIEEKIQKNSRLFA